MTRPYLFGIAVLLALSCLEVSSKPSNSELAKTNKELTNEAAERERSLAYDETNTENEDVTKDILEKIKAINDALKKPIRRHQFQWNAPPQPGGEYVLDKEVLEKLQQVIASGKLNHHTNHAQQDSNRISNDDLDDTRYSRQLTSLYGGNPAQMAVMPGAYIMNMPVLVMPSMNTMYGNSINPTEYATKIQTKEGPSPSPSPFPSFPSLPPFQWPFAPLFPILIRDPLLSIMNGGGWNNFIEYGQNADVCRRQKSNEATIEDVVKTKDDSEKSSDVITNSITNLRSRQKRAVKKRTVAQGSQLQDIDSAKLNKFFGVKPSSTTAKPSKREPVGQDTKTVHHDDGDVRFGFLDLFGNKNGYRQPTGPGFFINRLKVRRGGVAIAGPGGVATAGRGGTAIVGPGGLAYTQPGGLAVAGPAARIVALSPDADLTAIAHRLQAQSKYGRGWRRDGQWSREMKSSDQYIYNGMDFQEVPLNMEDTTFMLFIKPIAHALNSQGTALANPISQVVIARNQSGTILHAPLATAVAGPGGVAHAASVQYVPFYGGAKGQYLEIKKDNLGRITGEKIVSEENISSENILKNNNDENLLAKVMAANLQNLRTLSTNLLKLHNLGRKTGSLGNVEKSRYKTQLASLGEAASNIIKLIEEVDDVNMLFKRNSTVRSRDDDDDDYVAEEGVGIDSADDDDPSDNDGFINKGTIAEAKPVGLAVIGEHGLAASRPLATAVAASGVALARPVATAVAGVDPTALGINFQVNHSRN
ncbi:uncharacterized protein LOC118261894 [Spodoptera frugiperda]|uniref:Uncharacterized protein LOC118261894 n=1 Tax=Spodoptera frugiperda TaxID=7108 RepID=A0A9R0CTR2_SPOFR|nr:uncharacterized protein LOC118261894 [Spodoptera frugiperda]